ncbi:hypothetical protein ANN_22969 [Periplaneta americana]|uniref:Uncharacterized protein n=1 Tax=Periplaneta americana TaxID=6978 RepID=A0ABQ8SK83_PERAM|nr:hypothetical protein ANN_22969 [Periplaneta americana]
MTGLSVTKTRTAVITCDRQPMKKGDGGKVLGMKTTTSGGSCTSILINPADKNLKLCGISTVERGDDNEHRNRRRSRWKERGRQRERHSRMTHLAKAGLNHLRAGPARRGTAQTRPVGRLVRHRRMQQTPVRPQVFSCARSRPTHTA